MIQSGMASLVVISVDTEPDRISELLTIDPTDVIAKGTVLRSGRVREHHVWSLETEWIDNTEDDQTGVGALGKLLDLSVPAAGKVASLPPDCEARIWWSAESDSAQGGFVFPAELAMQLGALGVDLYGTVYVEGDESEPD